ncbi:MAG: anhydro-N-acetylmuramic acid kinase [Nitrospirae bacterium]|nr:MAG: anhydro-N-acetylmuramic acid kinase [Nitrospirota bacterium]
MNVLGLMSGTSADGVDAAVVEIHGTGHRLRTRLKGFASSAYPSPLRDRVLRAAESGTVADICHLHSLLGEFFARAALRAIKVTGLAPHQIDLIGSHGQTVHHRPRPVSEPPFGKIRSTLQLGNAAVIAERTGITTISDFRSRDLAAGGEGAPLTPYVHWIQFRHRFRARMVVNLGGIANLTYLPAARSLDKIQAFDTGPCNMLLDGLMTALSNGTQHMDRGGRLAQRGRVHPKLLAHLLAHPFFAQSPPKSTGREQFGQAFIQTILRRARRRSLTDADLLATCCRFIAISIAEARRWIPSDIHEVILGGGGVFNGTLVAELTQALHPLPVQPMDQHGIPCKAFEAFAFAVLAYQTWHGVCANIPAVTGARHPVLLGNIVPGRGGRSVCS